MMNVMNRAKETPPGLKLSDFEYKSLLIVDDDDPLRNRLARAMTQKGFVVRDAKSVENAIKLVRSSPPKFALIDLRLDIFYPEFRIIIYLNLLNGKIEISCWLINMEFLNP